MAIEVFAIGGYNEVGKNMTAVRYGKQIVVFDMGLHLDRYISFKGDEDIDQGSTAELRKVGAIPDDSILRDVRRGVCAIIPTHAHLDHVGALPFLSNSYNAPIICTPYTAEVIRVMVKDNAMKLRNPIKVLNVNSTLRLSEELKVEFINATHSTPQTVMVALHTPEGIVLYANDFKFDSFPIIGKKPNMKRLEELGESGSVKVMIVDGTRANYARKTPSEAVAREMLRDVMTGIEQRDEAVIVTTFSSHIARLKSIVEFGKKLDRRIAFLGRSLVKYINAAETIGLVNFSKDADMVKYRSKIKRYLKRVVRDGKSKYLLIVTGHQGEPDSVLTKMVNDELPFSFSRNDRVIFSCNIIPNAMNIANREVLESRLKQQSVRIFKDIHVSGHASREDHRDLINTVRPKHIIPAHGDISMCSALSELASEMGYELGKGIHLMQNNQSLVLE